MGKFDEVGMLLLRYAVVVVVLNFCVVFKDGKPFNIFELNEELLSMPSFSSWVLILTLSDPSLKRCFMVFLQM